jgi:hypothetical protein
LVVYHDFQRNVVPELLQDTDLQTGIYLWSMHDGAPPHFLLAFRDLLDFLALEDGTDTFSRNVGKGLPIDAA